MRTSAARPLPHTTSTPAKRVRGRAIFDHPARKHSIAVEAEAACQLKGNKAPCDYEEFMQRYGIKPTGDFE